MFTSVVVTKLKNWELVPVQHFDELCDELRSMVDLGWSV